MKKNKHENLMANDDPRIESRDNSLLKLVRAVRENRADADHDFLFIEGVRLAEEALRARLAIEAVIYTDDLLNDSRGRQLIDELRELAPRLGRVSAQLFSGLAETKTPQGIIVLAEKPESGVNVLERRIETQTPLFIVLHGVNNPANAGSIVRAAEAAGASGVISTKGAVNLFSPKALRGSMGSAFRLPIWMGATLADVSTWLQTRSITAVSADVRAKVLHTEYDWSGSSALFLGGEGSGLSAEDLALLGGQSISIPMKHPVESLNVAVAAGVVLFEAARQRLIKTHKP